MINNDITVVVPTIPVRPSQLRRALASVEGQTMQPGKVHVQLDDEGRGAPATRHCGLMKVTTDWVAFLDDDDEMMPNHLEKLWKFAHETDADYVYSWFIVKDARGNEQPHWDPFPQNFYRTWVREDPVQTTITTLVRTEVAAAAGFLDGPEEDTPDGNRSGEDFRFTLKCADMGAKIMHLQEKTWWWYHWGHSTPELPIGNTSGLASRTAWDMK